MVNSRFTYVIYIRTTAEALWQALIEPEMTKRYWSEVWQECDWKPGSDWKLMIPDGRIGDQGKVLKIEPRQHLALTWQNQFVPELKAEPEASLTYDLETRNEMVKLTVIHESPLADSKLIAAVSEGWPLILSSLKSMLETGDSLEATRKWPEGV